jgi:hypothetical protein
MHLPVVENAIATCKAHLEKTGDQEPEVAAYLTQYLLILIYSEWEKKIKEIVAKRADRTADVHLSSFVKSAIDRVDIRFSDLKGLLGKFGSDYKEAFSKRVKLETERTYGNIINNRHDVAHGRRPSTMTFSELQKQFEGSLKVLDAFEKALGVGHEI